MHFRTRESFHTENSKVLTILIFQLSLNILNIQFDFSSWSQTLIAWQSLPSLTRLPPHPSSPHPSPFPVVLSYTLIAYPFSPPPFSSGSSLLSPHPLPALSPPLSFLPLKHVKSPFSPSWFILSTAILPDILPKIQPRNSGLCKADRNLTFNF